MKQAIQIKVQNQLSLTMLKRNSTDAGSPSTVEIQGHELTSLVTEGSTNVTNAKDNHLNGARY